MQDFTNKIAVITGAASGIGRAIAMHCAQEKMRVVLVDRDTIKLAEVCDLLKDQGSNVISCTADVTCENEIANVVDTTLQTFGVPHLLFNNAGVGGYVGPLWELTAEKMRWVMDVNFMSVFYGIQKFVPHMLKANIEGHIINTASMAGLYTFPHFASYVISKHAVVVISECLHHDLMAKQSKINVSVLCPGGVNTNILEGSRHYPDNHNAFDNDLSPKDARWIANFAKLVRNGLSPAEVAEKVFAAIRNNKFYIITDPELKETANKRYQAIMNETQPIMLEFN